MPKNKKTIFINKKHQEKILDFLKFFENIIRYIKPIMDFIFYLIREFKEFK